MKDILKFWAVFSIGVAAGAAVALLCAPQSGDKTRKQLKSKLDDASDYVKSTASDLGDRAADAYNRGKSVVQDYSSDLADKATAAYSRGKDAVSSYSDDVVDNVKTAVKQGRQAVGA